MKIKKNNEIIYFQTLAMRRNVLEPLEFEVKLRISIGIGSAQIGDDILKLLRRDNSTPLSCITI